MTTFTDFRDRLNEHPEDWACLLALADFLMDTDPENPRIEGYKWLGHRRLRPWFYTASIVWGFWNQTRAPRSVPPNCTVPEDVLRGVIETRHVVRSGREMYAFKNETYTYGPFVLFKAVALAFSTLPAERRAELLAQEPLIETPTKETSPIS